MTSEFPADSYSFERSDAGPSFPTRGHREPAEREEADRASEHGWDKVLKPVGVVQRALDRRERVYRDCHGSNHQRAFGQTSRECDRGHSAIPLI